MIPIIHFLCKTHFFLSTYSEISRYIYSLLVVNKNYIFIDIHAQFFSLKLYLKNNELVFYLFKVFIILLITIRIILILINSLICLNNLNTDHIQRTFPKLKNTIIKSLGPYVLSQWVEISIKYFAIL